MCNSAVALCSERHTFMSEGKIPSQNQAKDIANILQNKNQLYQGIEYALGVGMAAVKQLAWELTLGCSVGNIIYTWHRETISAGAGLSWGSTIDVFACISTSCMRKLEPRNYSKSERKAEN